MATTDVSAVQTSSLLDSLHDFQRRFNENQRVKKLIKGWDRYLKVDGTDTNELYTVTIKDLMITKIEPGYSLPEDDEDVITLQAAQEALVRIFTGKYNPAHALIDGALAVFSGDRDKVKLEAIAMLVWGL
jgi:hypothetical protein